MVKKAELDTPYVILDLDKVEANIQSMQKAAESNRVTVRPHTKTHKLPSIAHMQIKAGAGGITVAKLGEAEVMASAGITNILMAYPVIGEQKIKRLIKLAEVCDMTIAVDSLAAAEPISQAARIAKVSIGMLAEIDCGFGRVGVVPGEEAFRLSDGISKLPGIEFKGLLSFPGHSYDAKSLEEIKQIAEQEAQIISETAELLEQRGIEVESVSVGSSLTAKFTSKQMGVTEVRPGTYIFGDLMQVARGVQTLEQCALTVKVTVISRPGPGRAVVDGGSKVFTSDGEDSPIGTGRGYVVNRNGIEVSWFTEEHGMLTLAEEAEDLAVGDTLEIIPVHCCAVVNMFDEVAAVQGEEIVNIWKIDGRGKVR